MTSHFKYLFPLKPEKKKKPIQLILNNIGFRDDDSLHVKKNYLCINLWLTTDLDQQIQPTPDWVVV